MSGRGSVNTENTAIVNTIIVVSGRGSVNVENTSIVKTIIVECQVEVP